MSAVCSSSFATYDSPVGPKAPALRSFALRDEDCRQIRRHLRDADLERLPFVGHVLRHKITMSDPSQKAAPRDAAIGGSCITYRVGDGPLSRGLLSHMTGEQRNDKVIAVRSPLGAALIGMRAGQRAPLLCGDGTIMPLTVISVTPPA